MKIISSPKAIQKICLQFKKKNKSIAVVPTMGFLHEGHIKLMHEARKKAAIVILTIFVNPTQFGPNEDLSRYPRDEKGDLAKAKKAGVDFVFMPKPADMYPEGYETYVEVLNASQKLCGEKRPGHFRGVATIVTKLFNITQPDMAFFGLKDFQQFAVIRRMVENLNFPIKLFGVPTVREKDGLAKSSRNVYLSDDERVRALSISRGLSKIKEAVKAGEKNIATLLKILESEIQNSNPTKIDYIEAMDAKTIGPASQYVKGNTLFAVAVFYGKTRLIDNSVI